ncbi:hypothetical protein PR202_gb29551 [Eleusine coracana subsp. coracana]|uniref:Uncharacterized protein n=1 Tax=Eleusine coracana subsp. coracana TaxID=191504 RepID=A0AAV5FZ64_ELECO|nr:hypothetical protein PR202_gb29551 [Eleusine coracana subsp. coracana]
MDDGEAKMASNHHHHLIDISPDMADAGGERDDVCNGGEDARRTKWLRKLTSATVNTAVLRDLISRTPMLWYLGERSGTILRPRTRGPHVQALHAVRAVAIGPFHRGDQQRGLPFPDDAKLPFMRYLQDQCGLKVERYVAALAAERDSLRDEFAVDDDETVAEATNMLLDDEERFLEMLLLDSCFVLVVSMMLSKAGTGAEADSVARAASINREYFILHMAVAQHADDIKLDMLVLENQIPLAAVKLLAASCSGLQVQNNSVEDLVLGCFDDICPTKRRAPEACPSASNESFHHVLHLFHWSRVPRGKYCILSTPLKLLRIKKESERLFPCYTELRRSAVWFRSSSSGSDFDMWFWRHPASPVAVMAVPRFHVTDHTAAVLHNLLAFEKHFSWATADWCTSAPRSCSDAAARRGSAPTGSHGGPGPFRTAGALRRACSDDAQAALARGTCRRCSTGRSRAPRSRRSLPFVPPLLQTGLHHVGLLPDPRRSLEST